MEFLVSKKKDGLWGEPMKVTAFASLTDWEAMWKRNWGATLTWDPEMSEAEEGMIFQLQVHMIGLPDMILRVVVPLEAYDTFLGVAQPATTAEVAKIVQLA